MRIMTKLFWIGIAIAGGAMLWSRGTRTPARRQRESDADADDAILAEEVHPDDLALAEDRGAAAIGMPQGISDVDPAPISQMTEAMDPVATKAAHQDIADQRERLPVPGKNLP